MVDIRKYFSGFTESKNSNDRITYHYLGGLTRGALGDRSAGNRYGIFLDNRTRASGGRWRPGRQVSLAPVDIAESIADAKPAQVLEAFPVESGTLAMKESHR